MEADGRIRIVKTIGSLTSNSIWNIEFNIVQWENSSEKKYDIRRWKKGHQEVGKGISLSEKELIRLKELLNSLPIGGSLPSRNKESFDIDIPDDILK